MDVSKFGSADSKEIIGGLETNFTIPTSGSVESANKTRLSFENNQPEDNRLSNTEKEEVSSIRWSKNDKIRNGSVAAAPRQSLLSFEKLENEELTTKLTNLKSVSFRMQDVEIHEELDTTSNNSYVSLANSATHSEVSQNHTSFSSVNSLKTSTTLIRKKISELENIAEVDENVSEGEAAPGYYGWDGYEARFEESMVDDDSWSSIPGCIPPWAKSVRKKYGLSPMESLDEDQVDESKQTTMKKKLEDLMKKHKELMLLKRVESKKQLIVEPNKDPNELDTVKMRAKNTRYYMAPLVLDGANRLTDDRIDENEKVSLPSLSDSNNLSISKKTSRLHAKKEVAQVLKSLHKTASKKKDDKRDQEYKVKKESDKCPKITLSDIREFVNMTPDERKLHEIIKIEKVPSVQDLKERCKPFSKYIINVPKDTITDMPTVNVIKIKEKRKIRVNSIENIEEKVTELHYNNGRTRSYPKRDSNYTYRESNNTEPRRHIKTTARSPTETKSFEVKTRQTPLLTPLIQEEDKKTEKVFMLQYDKKSKKDKHTTQFLGIKEPSSSKPGEMYLYGTESEGQRVTENLTATQEIPVTLKDKVHSIFEELRDLTLKENTPVDMQSAEVQVSPSVHTVFTQRSSHFQETTELTKPEVRSAAVQVRQSLILEGKSYSSMMLATPNNTPTSEFQGQDKIQSILDKDTLQEKLEDLVLDEGPSEKTRSIDEVRKDEMAVKRESQEELQEVTEEGKHKSETEAEVERKPQAIKQDKTEDETIKEEEKTDKLGDKRKVEQSGVAEITEKISDQKLKEKEIIFEDQFKGTTEQTQEEITPESNKNLSKVISIETVQKLSYKGSREPIEQIEEEKQTSSHEDEMRKLSKTSPAVSRQSSILQTPQDKDLKKIPSVSEDRKIPSRTTEDNEESDMFFKSSFPKELEDIRSYDFSSQQETELVITSSSKFLHKKDGLRKKMNWTNDTIFLENNTCPQLIRGLAETAMRRPADPIAFLAHWIYKDYESRERGEQEEVRNEHLQLARAMAEVAGGNAQTRKKFNVKKYPLHLFEEEKQNKVFEEESEFPDDILENKTNPNEIIQEA